MESVVAATNEPLHLEGGRIDMKSLLALMSYLTCNQDGV